MAVVGVVIGDKAVEARLGGVAQKVRDSLSKAMEREWYALQAHVVRDKLSGQVLGRKTGNLASSINVGGADSLTEFIDGALNIVGRVGTAVRYAAVHEYGGTFTVKSHTRKLTQVFGRPVVPREITVAAHTVTFPERSFLRSGLRDRAGQIRDSIQSSVQAALRA